MGCYVMKIGLEKRDMACKRELQTAPRPFCPILGLISTCARVCLSYKESSSTGDKMHTSFLTSHYITTTFHCTSCSQFCMYTVRSTNNKNNTTDVLHASHM